MESVSDTDKRVDMLILFIVYFSTQVRYLHHDRVIIVHIFVLPYCLIYLLFRHDPACIFRKIFQDMILLCIKADRSAVFSIMPLAKSIRRSPAVIMSVEVFCLM